MAARDATVRRLAATIASNSYRANPQRRVSPDPAVEVPAGLRAGYVAEVDPYGQLDPYELAKRVRAAYRRDQAVQQLQERQARLLGTPSERGDVGPGAA